jgi:hypothetical protein
MRRTIVLTVLIALSAAGAAQQTVEANPGMIQADSPLYGLDRNTDNVMIGIGLQDPAKVAYERASEMKDLTDRGKANTKVFRTAQDSLNSVAARASNESLTRLQKAQSVLQEVKANVPQQAQPGINNALDNVHRATQRSPSGDLPMDSGEGAGSTPEQVPDTPAGQ